MLTAVELWNRSDRQLAQRPLAPLTKRTTMWSTTGRLLLATWSVAVLLTVTFPVDAGRRTVDGRIHGVASGLSSIAVIAAAA